MDGVGHVTGHKQIQAAVTVVVKKDSSCSRIRFDDTDCQCDVTKHSVSIVLKESILAVVRDIDIQITVIIDVADCASRTKTCVTQP